MNHPMFGEPAEPQHKAISTGWLIIFSIFVFVMGLVSAGHSYDLRLFSYTGLWLGVSLLNYPLFIILVLLQLFRRRG